jgi:hypothetical protein
MKTSSFIGIPLSKAPTTGRTHAKRQLLQPNAVLMEPRSSVFHHLSQFLFEQRRWKRRSLMTSLSIRYALILAGLFSVTMTGCTQPVPPYSDHDGFSMAYPRQGDDIHAVVEALLNRRGNPHLTNNNLNGVIKFEVISARVLKADNIVPRPEGTMTSFPIRGHTIVHFPNGQVLTTEHCDAITGWWHEGHLREIEITQWSVTDAGAGTPMLDNLDPAVVSETQNEIRKAHDLVSLQFALDLPSSLCDLIYHFSGHDVVNTQYDFTSWQRANKMAMQYVDAAFGDAGGPMPWEQNGNHADSDVLPPMTPPQATQAPKSVTDQITVTVTPQISFSIFVSDPKWAEYKSALPQFQFDSVSWSEMAQQGAPRIQMEKRLYVEINASLEQAQKQTLAANQTLMNELAQAGYVANQPGATLQQRNVYATLRAKNDPILARSTRYLIAVQILLRSIQNDITTQKDGGG